MELIEKDNQLNQQIERFEQLMTELIHYLHAANPPNFIDSDLTEGQCIAGSILFQYGACNMNEIASRLGVSMSAATGIIDRMVKHGYAERQRDESDRRLVRVQLTEKGKQIISEFNQHKMKGLRQVLSVLSEEDRIAFLGYIQKIVDALQQQKKQKN
ncbi:MAG: MarR family transcriptional regulator [bacterium]|nr:MarR family transcriptional regulator [bacterium]